MKLTTIFLFVLIFCLHAENTNSQNVRVTVKQNNVELQKVLNLIENQTDYLFVYDQYVNVNRKVSVNLNKRPLGEALGQLFENTDIKFAVDGSYIVLSNKEKFDIPLITQQGRKITGTIFDTKGEPVIGANVVVKGTTTGTVTDIDGNFSLEVPQNGRLIVSYIGYLTKEIPVGNQNNLTIALTEDTQMLEEVVVVGYGTLKKENLTGAVAQLKGNELVNRPVQNVQQALQGKVANLNIMQGDGGTPGAAPSISIRGYSGFGTSTTPLVVIDGVQGGSLATVNMDDVESISVLKDAASAAIYGSSAPFGVIIINTKKGRRVQSPTITYSNTLGFAQPINLPKTMNSVDFATIVNETCDNAGVAHYYPDEQVQRIKDFQAGILKETAVPNPSGADSWSPNGDFDWFDILYKNFSFSQQHNIGVSGGSENSSYYIGLGYNGTNGMFNLADDPWQRYNVRANLSTDLTQWLTFNFKGTYSRANTQINSKEDIHQEVTYRLKPVVPLRYPNGSYYPVVNEILSHNSESVDNMSVLTGEFVVRPLPGWDITANYTYDSRFIVDKKHIHTTYNVLPSGIETPAGGTSPNSISRNTQSRQRHVVNLFSSYEKQLNDHYFKVLLGFAQEFNDNLGITASNTYLYSDAVPSLSLTYNPTATATDTGDQLAIRGGFGRINYNYKEKYLLELNGRYDGTSRFMKDVRYRFYPGVSAAWVLSKETFWKPLQSYVNTLKFRASYAQLGDQSFTGNYPFFPSMSMSVPTSTNWLFSTGRRAYASAPGLVNPNLTWVTVNTLGFGADLDFLDRRLNMSFDWYKRSGDDYVGPAESLPSLLGARMPQTNNAAMETKGWELSIGWNDRMLDNELHYSVNLVLSDYRSKVGKYPDNPTKLYNNWYEGREMGEIWGYVSNGLFQSEEEVAAHPSQAAIHSSWTPGDVRYEDLNGDGKIDWGNSTVDNPGDKKVIGNKTPRYQYGLTLAAEYKGFDFSVFAQGVGKRDAWIVSNALWGYLSTGEAAFHNLFDIHYDRWTPDNPAGYFPKYYWNAQVAKNIDNANSRYLQNAAYMRIKNLQIGYSLPARLIEKIKFDRVRVYASVENLATFTKMFKTIDPEFIDRATTDKWHGKAYPLQRTWSFGVNLTF